MRQASFRLIFLRVSVPIRMVVIPVSESREYRLVGRADGFRWSLLASPSSALCRSHYDGGSQSAHPAQTYRSRMACGPGTWRIQHRHTDPAWRAAPALGARRQEMQYTTVWWRFGHRCPSPGERIGSCLALSPSAALHTGADKPTVQRSSPLEREFTPDTIHLSL